MKMWLWFLIVPVALVLLAFAVGSFLPERYTAKKSFEFDLSPDEVWARLHDPKRHPMTGKMCRSVEVLPSEDGFSVWTETMSGSTLRIRDVSADEPRHFKRELTDTVVPFRSECEFWIEPTETGTRVTCENEVRISSGTWHVPLFRISLSLFGGANYGINTYLGSLEG